MREKPFQKTSIRPRDGVLMPIELRLEWSIALSMYSSAWFWVFLVLKSANTRRRSPRFLRTFGIRILIARKYNGVGYSAPDTDLFGCFDVRKSSAIGV